MSAHTPGPWVVGRTLADGTACIVGDGDSVVCTFDGRSHPEADAALIASAPELLAALKAAMAFIDAHVADPDITHEMTWRYAELLAAKPEAAIAKAEGRA